MNIRRGNNGEGERDGLQADIHVIRQCKGLVEDGGVDELEGENGCISCSGGPCEDGRSSTGPVGWSRN